MEAPEHPEAEPENQTPEPEPDPEPQLVTISVDCGNPNCDGHFEFPNMDRNTDRFKFTCNKCGSENEWVKQ